MDVKEAVTNIIYHPLDELPLVLQRFLQPSQGSVWVTESSKEGQISHRTGPKGKLLLEPQPPISFRADVAAKVAAAGLHLNLRLLKVDLPYNFYVGIVLISTLDSPPSYRIAYSYFTDLDIQLSDIGPVQMKWQIMKLSLAKRIAVQRTPRKVINLTCHSSGYALATTDFQEKEYHIPKLIER
jgi:hypothetical protein